MIAVPTTTATSAPIMEQEPFWKKGKTGKQVANRNAKNSVKAGKKTMRQLRKASRNRS
ncbi:hypothetical protein [Belliella pelovolcani]|uniref:hypothetical protein n=1 Tax=Belliella pelovolcani TaxID=529505 RepID=UPI003918A17D